MTRFRLTALIGSALLCACGDGHQHAHDRAADPTLDAATHPPRTAHWDYQEDGPTHWAELSPDYVACAEGTRQSPIDLSAPGSSDANVASVQFKTHPGVMVFNEHVEDIVDNGHTLQVNFDDSTEIVFKGVMYELKQFHFHTPSEHTLSGRRFPMEVHYVHQSETGRFLVVGAFLVEGEHNHSFDHLVSNLPNRGETSHVERVVTSLEEMAPLGLKAYHYTGSLTTPPCLEGVTWFISRQTIEMSARQLRAFAERMGHNARPVQALNDRPITEVSVVEVDAH